MLRDPFSFSSLFSCIRSIFAIGGSSFLARVRCSRATLTYRLRSRMDPRLSASPSFYGFNEHKRHQHQLSSQVTPDSPFSSRGPIPIPSRPAMNFTPPPLPPPPQVRGLEDGHDAGSLHAHPERSTAALPPINPNSSLCGGHRRPALMSHSDRMALDESEGRQGGMPLSRSPEAQIKIQPPPPADEGFPNAMSINSAGPILKGERDFSLRSVQDSSNAYDQHLLSKIGSSLSPRGSMSHGSDHRGSISSLTVPLRSSSNLPSPGPSEGSTLDVKWFNSPQSGGVSPGTKMGWREYIEGRSPSVESLAPSSGMEYDSAYMRDLGRRRYRGRTSSREDSISLPSRSNRGSYDQSVFSDIEGDFSTDEPVPPRQFILREPTPPYPEGSRQGMKRRASSPPREPLSDDRHTLHMATSNGDLSQRRTSSRPFTNTLSVNSGYAPSRRTLSAASSLSIRTSGSYSSNLSLGGSSMTSLSPYDRPSPGGLSSSSDLDTYHEKSILNSSSPGALIQPRALPGTNSLEPPTTDATGKVPMPTILSVPKGRAPKVGGLFICDCCPKKPKKFDNPDDLR